MYCVNCGMAIRDGVAFCDACGVQIKANGRFLENTVSDVPVGNPSGIPGEQGRTWVAFISLGVAGILALMIVLATVFNVDFTKVPGLGNEGTVGDSGYSDSNDIESDGDQNEYGEDEGYVAGDGELLLYDNDGNQIIIDGVDEDGYIMPNADTYEYEEWEISDWDEDKTQYAINELYARHGQDFDKDNQNEDVREYEEWLEENTTWYDKIEGKTVEPKEEFNDTEYYNFILLTDHREALNEQF